MKNLQGLKGKALSHTSIIKGPWFIKPTEPLI